MSIHYKKVVVNNNSMVYLKRIERECKQWPYRKSLNKSSRIISPEENEKENNIIKKNKYRMIYYNNNKVFIYLYIIITKCCFLYTNIEMLFFLSIILIYIKNVSINWINK